ncbi:MAG TPA: class I adenylate-forming enzyme family protein, partial [Vicinamibacterales bacterium]|nr:class I adenylate-forming enzyme family protein [Vicinamibacterales bacterium]
MPNALAVISGLGHSTAVSASAIGDRFQQVCRERSAAVAVRTISTGEATSFAGLAAECASILRALNDAGIGRGSVIVSAVGNRSIFIPLFVACMDAGAALVALGEATDAEAAALVEQSGAIAVIADRELPLRAVREREIGTGVRLLRLADRKNPPSYGSSVVLKLTSGSTHLPKAAIAAERHLVNDGRHIIDAMGIGPTDVNFACLPLSHSYAIGNIVMPLVWQGSSIALRQSFNPAQFVRDVTDTGATVFPGVPFMFERIRTLESIERLPASLRLLITAGARIDAGTVAWFRTRLDRKVHSFYGSSETGGIAYDDSEDVSDPLHVGRAMPETSITIRPPEPGQSAGRIFVEGNAVASGYARPEEGDADDGISAFSDGGFLTGDLGSLDEEGRLFLSGRVSPLVNVAGRKVDPGEVERRLLELPGIAD